MRISDWSSDVCSSDLDRKFRKSEVAGNASEGVAKSVRRDAFDPCQAAHTLQAIADRGERAFPNRRWKQVRVAGNLRLRFEHKDCGGPKRTNLRPALGVGKPDIAATDRRSARRERG